MLHSTCYDPTHRQEDMQHKVYMSLPKQALHRCRQPNAHHAHVQLPDCLGHCNTTVMLHTHCLPFQRTADGPIHAGRPDCTTTTGAASDRSSSCVCNNQHSPSAHAVHRDHQMQNMQRTRKTCRCHNNRRIGATKGQTCRTHDESMQSDSRW